MAASVALTVGVVLGTAPGAPTPAAAAAYPSWSDVLAARGKERQAQQTIERVRAALADVQRSASEAATAARTEGDKYFAAQTEADREADRAARLRSGAERQAARAAESTAAAGALAAGSARISGQTLAAAAISSPTRAEHLLFQLGTAAQLSERAAAVEATATNAAHVTRSLERQATVAASALAERRAEAQRRMASAQTAADRARSALAECQAQEATLQAQLATLTTGRVHTEQEFRTGEAARQAAAAAAAAAAAENANKPDPGSGAGGGAGGAGGGAAGGGSGWVRPAGGGITSPYGWRVHPITGVATKHDGIDLGSGCGTAIVAASAGTVGYAGWFGGYGNFVRIDHSGGTATAYGHIVDGGIRVTPGQRVSVGQVIALVGSTGNSTGCHLHFETRQGATTTDPVPFMSARGVRF